MSEGLFWQLLHMVCENVKGPQNLMQRQGCDVTDKNSRLSFGTSPESQVLRSVAGVQP